MRGPALSIAIICDSEASPLEATLNSIITEHEHTPEILVVDTSEINDNFNIYNKYRTQNLKYIHPNEHGKYNSLNKALASASGDSILLLEAGTRIGNLSQLLGHIETFSDNLAETVVYGDSILRLADRAILLRAPDRAIDADPRIRYESVLWPRCYFSSHQFDPFRFYCAEDRFLREALRTCPGRHVELVIAVRDADPGPVSLEARMEYALDYANAHGLGTLGRTGAIARAGLEWAGLRLFGADALERWRYRHAPTVTEPPEPPHLVEPNGACPAA